MKNPKLRILNYLLAVCNLILAVVLYSHLPDQIPMHWSFDGNVTYQDKWQLFILCGIALFLAVMFDLLPKIDPRKEHYQNFGPFYDSFCIVMQIFMLSMTGIVLTETFRPNTISVPKVVSIGIGLLLIFIGNMMPKFKSNFYCGIKTPWTLSNEEVWRKTHRLGGKCFFIAGLFFIIGSFFLSNKILLVVIFVISMTVCLIPTIMSYIWWHQEEKK